MKRVIVYSDGMQTTEKYHGFLLEWAQEKTDIPLYLVPQRGAASSQR